MEDAREFVLKRDFGKTYPTIVRGEGVYLIDRDGNRYLDGCGGTFVATIGHGVKEVIDSICEQAQKGFYTFVGQFTNEPQINLAKKMVEMSPKGMSNVYFTSGGSEAVEIALKLARLYHLSKGNATRWRAISRWQNFHGTTMACLSMTGTTARRADYLPYYLDFPKIVPILCYRCSYGDTYPRCGVRCAYDFERVIKQEGSETIACFISEPISNTHGASIAPPEYYKIIRSICDKYDIVMIADCVLCGSGRTGRYFAIEYWDVSPDVIVAGKGVAGGYAPLAAVIIQKKLYDALANPVKGRSPKLGVIGYSYAANPICCAAGLAVQNYIEKHQLVSRSERIGNYLKEKLSPLLDQPIVGDIRGRGCLLAIEFVKDKSRKTPFPKELGISAAIEKAAFNRGLIITSAGGTADGAEGDYISIAPPFNIPDADLDKLIDILQESIKEVQKKNL